MGKNKTKIENRFLSPCAEFIPVFKTVFVIVLALLVFDFYSFENSPPPKKKKKKSKISNFLRKPYQTQKNFMKKNRVRIQFYICCANLIKIVP